MFKLIQPIHTTVSSRIQIPVTILIQVRYFNFLRYSIRRVPQTNAARLVSICSQDMGLPSLSLRFFVNSFKVRSAPFSQQDYLQRRYPMRKIAQFTPGTFFAPSQRGITLSSRIVWLTRQFRAVKGILRRKFSRLSP
jgi:hypothetical protein